MMQMWTKLRPGVHKFLQRAARTYQLWIHTNGTRPPVQPGSCRDVLPPPVAGNSAGLWLSDCYMASTRLWPIPRPSRQQRPLPESPAAASLPLLFTSIPVRTRLQATAPMPTLWCACWTHRARCLGSASLHRELTGSTKWCLTRPSA
jgi:hypothetical protein